MYLQYLTIFLKSFSILFFPNGSVHFLLALVNAFFFDLYLNSEYSTLLFSFKITETKNKYSHHCSIFVLNRNSKHFNANNERRISIHIMFHHLCLINSNQIEFDFPNINIKGSHNQKNLLSSEDRRAI